MFELASGGAIAPGGGVLLEGGVIGTPVTGQYRALCGITGVDGSCEIGSGSATFTDSAGNTVTTQEWERLCPGGWLGNYTITGGTGIYQGATGSGTTTWQLIFGGAFPVTFTAQYVGSFEVPGTTAVASKRTFKMRGTLSKARVCHSKRRCTSLDLSELRQLAALAPT